uniref:Uncharacterized protein n=1 Tax=candidate division WOR-3 bacterium TaxID=2052148 RepID=A0A7C3N8A1_UNCW3
MDLRGLIAEKEEIENRMNKLEQMKGQIKIVVYEKIKKEYEEKLKNIFEQIKKDSNFIKSEIESINRKKEKIKEEIDNLDLEIEEISVRNILGEINPKDFEEKKNLFERKREELLGEFKKLQENEHELSKILPEEKSFFEPSVNEFKGKIVYEDNLVYPESKSEQPFPPLMETSTEDVNPEELEKNISEGVQTAIDNIISPDIVKEEKFELGEDLPKEEKMVKDNPLEINNKKFKSEEEIVFEKDFDVNVKDENIETIEGLICPKCGHVNRSDLFNCEKCGAELL